MEKTKAVKIIRDLLRTSDGDLLDAYKILERRRLFRDLIAHEIGRRVHAGTWKGRGVIGNMLKARHAGG